MKHEEMKDIATPIIESGFNKGVAADDIKGAMVQAKIPFGKINSLFKTIAIELNLMRDPAEVREEIDANVTESDWESVSTWDELLANADEIVAEIDGATDAQVLARVRAFYKDQGMDLPKKTAKQKRARGGKLAAAVVDVFGSIQKPTRQEMYEAVLKVSKFQRNAYDYTNAHHALYYALCNNMTLEEVAAETKDMTIPAKIEKGQENEMAEDHFDDNGNYISE